MQLPNKQKNQLARVLRSRRKAKCLTQMELSKLTNITQSLISNYESGKTTPNKSNLDKLLNILL